MLFGVIAHEKLLDLEASGVPPREADQERVRARAAGQARGFGVEKKPLIGIFGQARGAIVRGDRGGQQERQGARDRRTFFGTCMPSADGQMLTVAIACDLGANDFGELGPFRD